MSKTRTFLINGKSFDMQRIDTVVRVGAVKRWDVENTSTMDHPLHVHGTLFQVISRTRNGREVAEPFIAWRDTVNVPPNSTASCLIRQNDLGKRMYHCRILEYEDRGMMGMLNVVDQRPQPSLLRSVDVQCGSVPNVAMIGHGCPLLVCSHSCTRCDSAAFIRSRSSSFI